MPELPEVETIVNQLSPLVKGKTFENINVIHKSILNIPEEDFNEKCQGKKILDLKRRGKFIVFNLKNALDIVIHLRMTGMISLKKSLKEKHLSAIINFKENFKFYFYDIRKFAKIEYLSINDKSIGREALSEDLLSTLLNLDSNKAIKAILLDQTIIAGLGNIYCDEALFQAKIHPLTPLNKLSKNELIILHDSIKKLLLKSIKLKGCTISDFRDIYGEKGNFAKELKIYGKNGKECFICSNKIEKIKVAGRSSSFCPKCQNQK